MADSEFVFEITSPTDFEQKVLNPSFQRPVLVDFWAAWCQPCQMLMPILSKLADEFGGQFLLAKVNSDEQQELAAHFGVRSLPTVKVFRDGEVVDEFMGVQPESAIRALLDKHVVRESDLARQEAEQLREAGQVEQAIALLENATAADPDNPRVRVDLLRALISAERYEDAERLYEGLAFAEKQNDAVRRLASELKFRRQAGEPVDLTTLQGNVEQNPADLGNRVQLAAQLVVTGQLEGAMDQYLEVMKRDRNFDDDAGRKGLLEIFTMLGDEHPAVNVYRRKMFALMH